MPHPTVKSFELFLSSIFLLNKLHPKILIFKITVVIKFFDSSVLVLHPQKNFRHRPFF